MTECTHSQQCVRVCQRVMSGATPCIPPSVQQEVGRQEAAEVRGSPLGTVWWPAVTMNTLPRVLKTSCVSNLQDERMQAA